MKCPVCKSATGIYYWPNVNPDKPDVAKDYPLYQRHYVVAPRDGLVTCHYGLENEKPISPRCHSCYAKEIKRLRRKHERQFARSNQNALSPR